MFVPSLNLDGTLKKRTSMQERLNEEGQPGLYSPRIPSSTVQADKHFPPGNAATSAHDEPPAVAISDPEVDAIFSHHSPSGVGSGSAKSRSPSGSRHYGAMATLVEHQQARQSSTSVPRLSLHELLQEGSRRSSESASGGGGGSAVAAGARGRKTAGSVLSKPLSKISFEEAYIMGRPLKEYLKDTNTHHPTKTATGSATGSSAATLRQNPTQYISSIASSGDYIAIGDRTGRVVVMERRPMTSPQQKKLLQLEKLEENASEAAIEGKINATEAAASPTVSAPPPPRSKDLYRFHVCQQAYSSVIDPLNSVEVTPNVVAMAFLPQTSAASYLLTANEKVPKLYKLMTVRESAQPFRAVDKIGIKTIGPLTASSRGSTVAMKMTARYALHHEYNINSICPLSDSEQFVTADDLTMQLWCTEYPDTSIETFDLRPAYDEEPREVIRGVRSFPHEPFLLFAVTSAGNVRVIDVRQGLKWVNQTSLVFCNPPREADSVFNQVTNSLSDCALSPCGRYIAGRDFMTVCLWDVRVSGGVAGASSPSSLSESNGGNGIVRSWELHPHLRDDLETLYQSDLLFEKFDLSFMSRTHVCTGGFNNSLYTIDVTQGDGEDPLSTADASGTQGVNTFQLPSAEGVAETRKAVLAPVRSNALTSSKTGKDNMLELGTRITLMSRPVMSHGGTCGMIVSCGQVMMQLSYNGLMPQ